uniref:Uncharacterized protein n=1 Tax=Coccolithus braarudii TaxID=221442 RepID=A0A7S0L1G5_9EUKA|mmetsp:Transcript_14536/g.31493  ORF Transcript_14536/g.31493 Transcript_14536/m.31493 type:complete len:100 (+) Transcript_14536:3-302(+)
MKGPNPKARVGGKAKRRPHARAVSSAIGKKKARKGGDLMEVDTGEPDSLILDAVAASDKVPVRASSHPPSAKVKRRLQRQRTAKKRAGAASRLKRKKVN